MKKERKEKAVEAFMRTFPHLSDSTGITNVWCKAVEWADKHNPVIDAIKECIKKDK